MSMNASWLRPNGHARSTRTSTETEGEENEVNPDQLRISLEFEKRAKPADTALGELMESRLDWRYKEKEEILLPKEEDVTEEEEEA
jgi:hypothetical protein